MEVTVSFATGEIRCLLRFLSETPRSGAATNQAAAARRRNSRPGKIRHGVIGDSNPTSVHLRERRLHQRSIRALHHWPFNPGGMSVYGLFFRVTVDETVDFATQV